MPKKIPRHSLNTLIRSANCKYVGIFSIPSIQILVVLISLVTDKAILSWNKWPHTCHCKVGNGHDWASHHSCLSHLISSFLTDVGLFQCLFELVFLALHGAAHNSTTSNEFTWHGSLESFIWHTYPVHLSWCLMVVATMVLTWALSRTVMETLLMKLMSSFLTSLPYKVQVSVPYKRMELWSCLCWWWGRSKYMHSWSCQLIFVPSGVWVCVALLSAYCISVIQVVFVHLLEQYLISTPGFFWWNFV